MVFDYMDHDLTGLMDRLNHKLPVREVIPVKPIVVLHLHPQPLLCAQI